MEQLINKLKNRLAESLPGQEAQYLMAPIDRELINVQSLNIKQYRPSAVLILLCLDDEDNLFMPLTERMSYNGAHSAQISLPGGKYDDRDIDLMKTAIRECYEEIGVKVSTQDVIGRLTELFIPVSGFLVQPFVAVCNIKNPVMINQEREVKSILKFSINNLMNEQTFGKVTIPALDNLRINTPYYDVDGHKVWGATAMILSELKEILKVIF